ncbi:MAG TPA: cytochrome c biogenesis protein CcsA [Gemmatimonadaceae bacterium]|nr:cytochrome c biogenesis protein CcsA [Gemmatimonadaceae bacterium]
MPAIAHLLAICAYGGAAALAAAPFVRPVAPPVRGVVWLLAIGVTSHAVGLLVLGLRLGAPPVTGMGPALSFAAFLVAAMLLAAELLAREVSLTLAAAPLAAIVTIAALGAGLSPLPGPIETTGHWLTAHVAMSFLGIAAFATAAAAGLMYLVERRELKSRRFGAIFRFFPPLETLDRVNHVAAVVGWLALTVGVALAGVHALAFRLADPGKIVWAFAAWLAVTALTGGRVIAGWRARRAAVVSSISFAAVVALYIALRLVSGHRGQFL